MIYNNMESLQDIILQTQLLRQIFPNNHEQIEQDIMDDKQNLFDLYVQVTSNRGSNVRITHNMAKSLIENITIGRVVDLENPYVQFSVWYQGSTFSTIYDTEEESYDDIAYEHKFIEFYDGCDPDYLKIPDMVKKQLNEMTASRGYSPYYFLFYDRYWS